MSVKLLIRQVIISISKMSNFPPLNMQAKPSEPKHTQAPNGGVLHKLFPFANRENHSKFITHSWFRAQKCHAHSCTQSDTVCVSMFVYSIDIGRW